MGLRCNLCRAVFTNFLESTLSVINSMPLALADGMELMRKFLNPIIIIKQKAGEPAETFVSTGSPAAFGAADEARTRYLHLGKVALYQMSYGRIKKSPKIVR